MIKLSPFFVFWIVLCLSIFEMTLSTFAPTPELPHSIQPLPPPPKEPSKKLWKFPKITEALNSPSFGLRAIPCKHALPDLRGQILYYGSLIRPDSSPENAYVCLMLKGDPEITYIKANSPLYLKYDNEKNIWRRTNESPLQLCVKPKDKVLDVSVSISMGEGQNIREPSQLAAFTLGEIVRPPNRTNESWSSGDLLVDATLLERQHVRWYGVDEIYKTLSTNEDRKDCQRLILKDENGEDYTLWVKPGSRFMYDGGRWQEVEPGDASTDYVLLFTKAVTESSLQFEIWDPEGSHMMLLTVSRQQPSNQTKLPKIQLIGARSKDTWIATIDDSRTLIKTDDWFLISEGHIEKIQDGKMLQEYLQGKKEGTLLAFSGIERVGSDRCLVGTSIDSSRTKSEPISIPLYHSFTKPDDTAIAHASSRHDHGDSHHRDRGRDHYYDDDHTDYDDHSDEEEIIEEEEYTYEE